MKSNKILFIIGVAALVATSTASYAFSKTNTENKDITVIEYRKLESKNPIDFEIKKFDKLEFVDWLDTENIIHLNKVYKGPENTPWEDRYILNSYNINSKEDKVISPDGLKMSMATSLSPDKKYIFTGTFGSPSLNTKMIDLKNKSFVDVKNADDVNFEWISENLLMRHDLMSREWKIEDLNGNVFKKGIVPKGDEKVKFFSYGITGTDLKKTDNSVEGKIYFLEYKYQDDGLKVKSTLLHRLDINTNVKETLFEKNGDSQFIISKGKIYEIAASENSNSVLRLLDDKGNIVKEYVLNSNNIRVKTLNISPDGKYAAYILEKATVLKDNPEIPFKLDGFVNIVNLDNGEVKQVFKCYDGQIQDLKWNENSKSIAFNCGTNKTLATYVVTLK